MPHRKHNTSPPSLEVAERVARLERENVELRRANAELKQRTLELFSVFELTTSLGANLRFDRLAGGSMDFLSELLGIERFSLLLHVPHEAREGCVITPPEGVAGYVFTTGQAMYVPDVTAEPRYLYYKGYGPQSGSLLAIPLLDDEGRPFGVLNISKPEANGFSDSELVLYGAVARQTSAVVQNFRTVERLRELSQTDELTGAANRRAFMARLAEEHERHQRYGERYTLLMIDVDFFKRYNDRHGHLEGDYALQKMTTLLLQRVRQSDILARYGGEEFVVMAVETGKAEGIKLAEALRDAVQHTRFTLSDGAPASELSITVGVAAYPEDGAGRHDVLERADKALYYGKSRGRNIVCAEVPAQNGPAEVQLASPEAD
jgi:diguanylate cyclase (GGDEF)-like protein